MVEPPRKRPFNTTEIALASMENALGKWRIANVPANVLGKPLKEFGFHNDLSEYLSEERGIKPGYALRKANTAELIEHFRKQIEHGKIAGGNLILFAGRLRQYLKQLK